MNKEELRKRITSLKDNEPREVLKLRGELITLIKKEMRDEKDKVKQNSLRMELYEELKKHKEHISKMNDSEEVKTYPISERVALKVKEIAATINVFKEKHDVVGKAKNVIVNTGISGLVVTGISLGLAALGGTASLATLAGLVPTLAYVGLSNLVRTSLKDTDFSKNIKLKDNKDEIIAKVREFTKEYLLGNKEYMELLNNKKNAKTKEELVAINEQLISHYKHIINNVPMEELGIQFKLELLNILRELKEYYKEQKEDYIHDRNKMTLKEFANLEKKILNIDIELFKEENYFREAGKKVGENITINTVTMYVARLVLSGIFPSLALDSISDIVTPFLITVLNNVANIENIRDTLKLRDSKYNDVVVKINNSEKLREMVSQKGMSLA